MGKLYDTNVESAVQNVKMQTEVLIQILADKLSEYMLTYNYIKLKTDAYKLSYDIIYKKVKSGELTIYQEDFGTEDMYKRLMRELFA